MRVRKRERERDVMAGVRRVPGGGERERDLLRFRYGRISVRSVFSRFTFREKCVPGEPTEVFTSIKEILNFR